MPSVPRNHYLFPLPFQIVRFNALNNFYTTSLSKKTAAVTTKWACIENTDYHFQKCLLHIQRHPGWSQYREQAWKQRRVSVSASICISDSTGTSSIRQALRLTWIQPFIHRKSPNLLNSLRNSPSVFLLTELTALRGEKERAEKEDKDLAALLNGYKIHSQNAEQDFLKTKI